MKNKNYLKRLITQKVLSEKEQKEFRLKLKGFSNINGIESICLEAEELFIEYNPLKLSERIINSELSKINFPANSKQIHQAA
ncbi:MAG: hypothetical protein AB7S69_10300 [Salinivirgaceae bacterium]